MDIAALQLESRFSFAPNSLGYCGRDTAGSKFKSCIKKGKCAGIENEVTNFIVLHPYLQTLAEITGLPLFSYSVIESYWLGNEQLTKARPKDYDLLLKYFSRQGVPDWLIDELKQKKPKTFIPSHLFQVLHIGVGRASGAVPFNLESINNCMIRWGKVEEIISKVAVVSLHSLKKAAAYKLTKITTSLPFDDDFVPGLQTGDIVAVHWNRIIKILSVQEEENLNYWTKKVIQSLSFSR